MYAYRSRRSPYRGVGSGRGDRRNPRIRQRSCGRAQSVGIGSGTFVRFGERIEMPIFPIPAIFGDFPSLESHEYNSNQFVSQSETILKCASRRNRAFLAASRKSSLPPRVLTHDRRAGRASATHFRRAAVRRKPRFSQIRRKIRNFHIANRAKQ